MKTILTIFSLVLFSKALLGQSKESRDSLHSVKTKTFALIPGEVDRVNGLAIGAWAENLRSEKDSLEINGLCTEINPVVFFLYARGVFAIPYKDSIESFEKEKQDKRYGLVKNGVNISVPGTIHTSSTQNGLNLTLLTSITGEMNGVSISALTNTSYVMNGVSVVGLYNLSKRAKGVQIGLVNISNSLKGFQFGLWNKNGKRSLPFINWQFRE